jgi:hypothetical protein
MFIHTRLSPAISIKNNLICNSALKRNMQFSASKRGSFLAGQEKQLVLNLTLMSAGDPVLVTK